MTSPLKAATTLLSGMLGVSACGWLAVSRAVAQELPPRTAVGGAVTVARLRWLVELGAESLPAAPRPAPVAAAPLVASVPGAVYVFDRDSDGRLRKRMRLPADSAAANGLAVAAPELALADRLGTVSVWTVPAAGALRLRWRRDLGERVTSLGWDGGPLVLAATWSGRLTALAAEDGSSKWSVDIGGRAEAPAVVDGNAVYVATKSKALLRVDARTGTLRWKVALPGIALHPPTFLRERAPGVGVQPPVEKTRSVLVGTWDGQLVAHDVLTGRLSWSAPLGARLASAPLVSPGLVAVVTADGIAHGYDSTGHALWAAPDAADGPATLFWQESTGTASRLLSVSRVLVGLELVHGRTSGRLPRRCSPRAAAALRRRDARGGQDLLRGREAGTPGAGGLRDRRPALRPGPPLRRRARLRRSWRSAARKAGPTSSMRATLRPQARYHAGRRFTVRRSSSADGRWSRRAKTSTRSTRGRAATAWKRTVGASPSWPAATAAGSAGWRTGPRIAAADGSLEWSLHGQASGSSRPWPSTDEPQPSARALARRRRRRPPACARRSRPPRRRSAAGGRRAAGRARVGRARGSSRPGMAS